MLVVIAIIAVLAALLLPVLSKAKLRAQRVHCLNNVRQLTIGHIMYTGDSGGRFVPWFTDVVSPHLYWMERLSSYMRGADQVRLCPATTKPPPPITLENMALGNAETPWVVKPLAGTNITGSYGINFWLNDDDDADDEVNGWIYLKEGTVEKPSQTPVFADNTSARIDGGGTHSPSHDLYAPALPGLAGCAMARHGRLPAASAPRKVFSGPLPGLNNIGFVDGHVASTPIESLWLYNWRRQWNLDAVPLPHPNPI